MGMRLDMDVVRSILLKVEEMPVPVATDIRAIDVVPDFVTAGAMNLGPSEMDEYTRLLEQAGLIEGCFVNDPGDSYRPIRLTWAGHKFVADIRSDRVYAKTKELSISTFGTLSIETMKALIPKVLEAILKSQGLA